MTDRHSGYLVTLEADVREDDAERIRDALGMVKGVLTVEPVLADIGTQIAQQRAEQTIRVQIGNILYPTKERR